MLQQHPILPGPQEKTIAFPVAVSLGIPAAQKLPPEDKQLCLLAPMAIMAMSRNGFPTLSPFPTLLSPHRPYILDTKPSLFHLSAGHITSIHPRLNRERQTQPHPADPDHRLDHRFRANSRQKIKKRTNCYSCVGYHRVGVGEMLNSTPVSIHCDPVELLTSETKRNISKCHWMSPGKQSCPSPETLP